MSEAIHGISINGVPLAIIGMAGLTTAILTYVTVSSSASNVVETIEQTATPAFTSPVTSTGGGSRKNKHSKKRNKTRSKR